MSFVNSHKDTRLYPLHLYYYHQFIMSINVNTATKEDLKQIPGIGEKVAQLIIQFREIYGVVKKEALNLAVRGNLSSEALEMIDFSVPRPDNPFDIDLSCLPSVPKTDSWEPLVSFAHQTAVRKSRSRSPSEQVTERWQPLTLPSVIQSERSRSPERRSYDMLASSLASQESAAMLAVASSTQEPQESRSYRTDSRIRPQPEIADRKPPINMPSGLSSRVKQKQPSKTTAGQMSSFELKNDQSVSQTLKSGETDSRSHTVTSTKSSKNRSRSEESRSASSSKSSSRSRSHHHSSRSELKKEKKRSLKSSKSRSRQSHSKKSGSRKDKERKRSSSRSSSRSRSIHNHSKKSDHKFEKEREKTSSSSSRSRSRHSKSEVKVEKKKKNGSSNSRSKSRSVEHHSRKSEKKE